MTDGQSFYCIMWAFYLFECLLFAPTSSCLLSNTTGRKSRWKLKPPLIILWGLKKAVHLSPIAPWPSQCFALRYPSDEDHKSTDLRLPSQARRWLAFTSHSTRNLRRLATLHCINFLFIIPVIYSFRVDERIVLTAIGIAYLLMSVTAVHFFVLHRKLFPKLQADRFKNLFYTIALPWHAMRCYQLIHRDAGLRCSPIAALASQAQSPRVLASLKRIWRNSIFQEKPAVSHASISEVINRTDLNPSDWKNQNRKLTGPQYCPCCFNEYQNGPVQCSDCEGVKLLASPSAARDGQ